MRTPKIIQILATPNDPCWQGRMLGLCDNGVTYEVNHKGVWSPIIAPLSHKHENKQLKEKGE